MSMCVQINNLFSCGHRSFRRFDNCPQLGQTCFGAGSNHKDNAVNRVCKDCKFRESQGQGQSQSNTPDGGTPTSNGEEAGGPAERRDPWWEGDPWRKYRKG